MARGIHPTLMIRVDLEIPRVIENSAKTPRKRHVFRLLIPYSSAVAVLSLIRAGFKSQREG